MVYTPDCYVNTTDFVTEGICDAVPDNLCIGGKIFNPLLVHLARSI